MKSLLTFKLLTIATLCLLSSLLQSQHKDVYDVNWKKEKYILGGTSLLLAGDVALNHYTQPLTYNEIIALRASTINSFDKSAVTNYSVNAAKASDYFRDGIMLLALTPFATQRGRAEWKDISVMYAETFLANVAVTSAIKLLSARPRPYVYNPDVVIEDKQTKFAKRSFISGHTSKVSSMSFFTASVLDDLYPDSNWKPVWWSAAISLPAITGVLRYEGGKHFPSDVVGGYIVGAAIGYFIPKLHKKKGASSPVTINWGINGGALTYQF